MPPSRRLLTAMSTSTTVTSYPRPTTLAERPRPICPGVSYTPLQAPPPSPAPALPPRPELAAPPGWTRSEHSLQAAYPRTFVESTGTLTRESAPFSLGPAPANEDKEAKKRRIMREVRGAITQRLDATMTYEGDGQPALWIAAERWARVRQGDKDRKRAGQGVSLVLTHANGFTKESWHPVIRRLLQEPKITPATFGVPSLSSPSPSPPASTSTRQDIEIDEVWFLDDIHHGASVDLNAGRLGPVHNWVDGGRDVVAAIEQTIRRESPGQKVIGIGHSFGANATVQAAHARPDLFEAILLVEPMCPPARVTRDDIDKASRAGLVFGALKRRGDWPTLAEAAKIRQSPFFASWHPEAFDLWLSHGLVPFTGNGSSNDAVQLATPKWGEAAVFAETEGLGLGWDKLAEVQVPVGFVMAGDATATDGEETTREMVWRPPFCANERFMDAGHLIVQEKPDELADAIRRFSGNVLLPSQEDSTYPQARL